MLFSGYFSTNDPLTRQLDGEILGFLLDRQARNLSPKTVDYYARSLTVWRDFLRAQKVTQTADVTATHIRRYLHPPDRYAATHAGGVVTVFTGLPKPILRWYAVKNTPPPTGIPWRKSRAPKRSRGTARPAESLSHFSGNGGELSSAIRSGATVTALSSCSCWIRESVTRSWPTCLIGDVDMSIPGRWWCGCGKGRKGRAVFIGAKTRRALLAYYRHRESLDDGAAAVGEG
jgi:site-specific recombinase XerC